MPTEFKSLLRLAGPVVLAEIGWMSMGVVDTIMVGPLGPAAISATGVGSRVFTAIAIFGMGLMLGLDALVSQAYGARRLDDCVRWLHHGVVLALAVTPCVMAATWGVFATMDWWGLHPDVRVLAGPYLMIVSFGTLPLLLYAACRRYLQGLHIVRPVMAALLSANAINAVGNWILVYGNLGMPALGVEGSAWATSIARLYMAGFLYLTIRRVHRNRRAQHPQVAFAVEGPRLRRLIAIGFPAAGQITLEVGVFATVTALAGRLDPLSSASHQIALNMASLAFMVPLGLSSAAAVRVGHSVGARDAPRAVAAGWTALGAGGLMMVAMAVPMLLWGEEMMRAFTTERQVIEIGIGLLVIAAAFQVFDGTQAVATGVLRGLGDTRTPVIMNVVGHWMLGLPAGYALCFVFGWGVSGLWIGLGIGLVFAAVTLTAVWMQRTRHLRLPGDAHAPAVPELL